MTSERVYVAALTALIISLSGCFPELDPRCPVGDYPELQVGVFGEFPLALTSEDVLPVWVPVQGGLVVGLNLLALDVPRDVESLQILLTDPSTNKIVGRYQVGAANFICQGEGLRMWSQVMVPILPAIATSPEELEGLRVHLSAQAFFPYGFLMEPVEARGEGSFLLKDELPEEPSFGH